MKKTNEYFFSYGPLQKEKFQMELIGRILNGSSDSLRGYKLSLHEVKGDLFAGQHPMAILTKNKDDLIDGTVFEISEEDLELLDSLEIDDYKRVKETLESGKEAWLYVGV